jgi:hypothetical protein
MYVFFSIQIDESTDAVDTAQLLLSIKIVFNDFLTREEFLKILPLTARTTGKNIFNLFKFLPLIRIYQWRNLHQSLPMVREQW